MFCPNCGSKMNDGASFCSNCGWKNNKIKKIDFEKITTNNRKIIPFSIIIVLFVAIAIFAMKKINNGPTVYVSESGDIVIDGWTGDYYIDIDGKPVINQWKEYDGEYYYCGADGKILKSQWVDDLYYVDENGKMLKNAITPDGYFVGNDGKYIDFNN